MSGSETDAHMSQQQVEVVNNGICSPFITICGRASDVVDTNVLHVDDADKFNEKNKDKQEDIERQDSLRTSGERRGTLSGERERSRPSISKDEIPQVSISDVKSSEVVHQAEEITEVKADHKHHDHGHNHDHKDAVNETHNATVAAHAVKPHEVEEVHTVEDTQKGEKTEKEERKIETEKTEVAEKKEEEESERKEERKEEAKEKVQEPVVEKKKNEETPAETTTEVKEEVKKGDEHAHEHAKEEKPNAETDLKIEAVSASANEDSTTTATTNATSAQTVNEPQTPTKASDKGKPAPKEKTGFIGKIKNIFGGGKKKNETPQKGEKPEAAQQRERSPTASPANANGAGVTKDDDKTGQTDKEDKKTYVCSTLEDLPEDCKKLVTNSSLPQDKMIENWDILLNVLHFRSGKILKTPANAEAAPRPRLPKSPHIKEPAELLSDMGELKKKYKDIEEVGKGGFGAVFHARTVKEKKMVAIKKMGHKTKKQKSSNFYEASILQHCNHPNIVKFYTCHEIPDKDELWLVMEFLEGGTFEEAVRAWRFNEANLAYVARELLKGISYLHSLQLAHRDLKSANIMMSVRGEVKLIDFGLCADISVGNPQHMVGSPFWMPPEMIQCKPHGTAVDIWSLGVSLLEMANQSPPMIENAVKAMFTVGTEGITNLFHEPKEWSDTFKDFLSHCMQMDPEERATADQLLQHDFIKKADSRANMENILKRIFLSNSLLNSGF